LKRKPGQRHIDPAARRLEFADWPEADRLAWARAFSPGDLLEDDAGGGSHWSEPSREKCQGSYGRWLGFLARSDRLDPDTPLALRITPSHVTAYIDHLRARNLASWSLASELHELSAAARVMALGHDWSWLRRIVRHLRRQIVPRRDKQARLRPAHEIAHFAYSLMDAQRRLIETEAQTVLGKIQRRPLGRYRTALMIALLICCPTMRIRNLTMIRIGRHLIEQSDGYRLVFAPNETKTGAAFLIPVPASLTAYIHFYLERVRPALLGATTSDRLWINHNGGPMVAIGISKEIKRMTASAFGQPINPHLFRDCAVTTVATDDPTHIGIAAPLLGHSDPRTTEKHYIQANQLVAGRRLRRSIDRLRLELRPRNLRRQGDPA
jgi:integrase/recombinase XerD